MKNTKLALLISLLFLTVSCGSSNDEDDRDYRNNSPMVDGHRLPSNQYEFCGTLHAVWGSTTGAVPSSRAIISNYGTYYLVANSSYAQGQMRNLLSQTSSIRACVYSSLGPSVDNQGAPLLRIDDARRYYN